MNTDIQVLTDKTVPWDLNKVKLLEQAIIFFYSNPSNPNVKSLIMNGIFLKNTSPPK